MIRKPAEHRTRRLLSWDALESRQLLSGLTYTITSNQQVYLPGQPVQLTLTETNNTSAPISFGVGPVDSGFDVSQNGSVVWASNAGVLPMYILFDTIQPGQSLTLRATWNGVANVGSTSALTGTFTVTNQQAPNGPSATFQINPSGETILASSVTTDQSEYQAGQLIHMTFTETNLGSQPVSLQAGASAFNVSQNGNVVWSSAGSIVGSTTASIPQTLQPGQSLTEQATWDGTPPGTSGAASGSFTLSNGLDPAGSTTFVIQPQAATPVSPQPPAGPTVVAQLVTGATDYRRGRAVSMTLDLTNTSSQTVTLNPTTAANGFSVSRGNQVIWHQSAAGNLTQDLTIAPGQTVAPKATWNGRPNQSGVKQVSTGAYTITANEYNLSATTTIQLGPARPAAIPSALARPWRLRK